MKNPRHKNRKRNCFDRLRARFITAKRAPSVDPAASAAMQLLALFTMVFGRMPLSIPAPAYVPYSPPRLSPAALGRADMARRLEVPVRYLDLVLSLGQVPYSVLFDHIRQGGVLRRDALVELRKRVPEASLDWLDHVQTWERWSDLVRCYVPGEQDEITDVRVLNSTVRWFEDLKSDGGRKPGVIVETLSPDGDPNTREP
ncbi:hypothetical protein HJB89_26160 [Rhizobium sp. NZLR8]|uniref:hypothetical protein n=1 Tax=Rhizobium sp. NZLR8 TaxID=2731104 RepID=UPI001C838BC1|nr:hypothetical protein [Rhizobium sp. NZLR8]MBX5160571.1 hypothetical protein [Rhizobium sp. NZLR8]